MREPRCCCSLVLTPSPCRIGNSRRFRCRPSEDLATRPKRPPKTALKLVRMRSCYDEQCPFLAMHRAESPRQFQPIPASDLRGVHEGGKWPDKAAECVFRDDHALRMCQREGVSWLVFNWRACFGWAFSFTPCRLHATRTATLWQTAYCICTRAVSPPPS